MNLRLAVTTFVLPILVCAAGHAANYSPSAASSNQGYSQPSYESQHFTLPMGHTTSPAEARQRTYWLELTKLRNKGLKIRKQDGGTLTGEHRALLQAKLDRINASWRGD